MMFFVFFFVNGSLEDYLVLRMVSMIIPRFDFLKIF